MNKKTETVRFARLPSTLILGAITIGFAGCGGGGGGATPAPAPAPAPATNSLPEGITQHSVTTYSATSIAGTGAGTTAATQDLLTGGIFVVGSQLKVPAKLEKMGPASC